VSPAPTYVAGRVGLVGDAATVTRPHTGSGATKALQDALALERACQDHAAWDAVLAAYNSERCAAGNELVELGRRLGYGQVERTPDWLAMGPADFDRWTRGMLDGAPALRVRQRHRRHRPRHPCPLVTRRFCWSASHEL
jgi:hypothetical protein